MGNRPLPGLRIMGGLSLRNPVVDAIESMAIGPNWGLPPKNGGASTLEVVGSGPGTRTCQRSVTSFEPLGSKF